MRGVFARALFPLLRFGKGGAGLLNGIKGAPMAQPATNGNILTKLDQRGPTRFLWQSPLLATVGGFLFGYDTSNIGSALNFVPYHLQGLALGYLVSGASLGAAAGAILGEPVADRIGLQVTMTLGA